LFYSGWFQWSAPGLFVTTLIVYPWKTAPRRALLLLGVTGLLFLIVTWHYVYGLVFDPASKVADNFVYFDVRVEPMYIAMWRNDLPGNIGTWPPHAELGGVGLFTLLLATGFGFAIALGRKTTTVIALGSTMAGAWFMRFWLAHSLWETRLVQLYPRTTPLILYCLLLLTGFAIYWGHQRLRSDSPLRGRSAAIGALCALMLVLSSAASSTADRYMPAKSDPMSAGSLALNAHHARWGTIWKPTVSRALPWYRRMPSPLVELPR
jgi:galactan 5-O-arabinofuranosyltransferase